MTYMYYVKTVEKMEETEFNFLLSRISEPRRLNAIKKKRISDQIQAIITELLVKYILQEIYKINTTELKFFKGKYGKPFVNLPIQFNISHSGNIIIAAFSETSEIGIDIEQVKQIPIEIFKPIFLKEEYKYIQNQPEKQRLNIFYKFWTLKESYIKYLGTGLYRDMNTFGFTLNSTINLKELIEPSYINEIQFITGNIENYKYSLCCKKKEYIHKLECIKINQILSKI